MRERVIQWQDQRTELPGQEWEKQHLHRLVNLLRMQMDYGWPAVKVETALRLQRMELPGQVVQVVLLTLCELLHGMVLSLWLDVAPPPHPL